MSPPVLTSAPFLPQIIASPDVVTEMTTFELAVLKAYMGLQPPLLIQMGDRDTTSSLAYKMPVSVGSSLFKKITGGTQYRQVGKLMLPITTDAWSDAVKAEALLLESDEWTGWGDQPESMGIAANLIGEAALASAIEAGETVDSIENFLEGDTGNTGIKFHAQAKFVDPFGNSQAQYSNLFTSTGTTALGDDAVGHIDRAAPMTLANIDRVWGAIHKIPSLDGTHYMDLEWVAVLVPRPMELMARRYFEDQGADNATIFEPTTDTSGGKASGADVFPKPNTARRYKVQVISSPYLTSATTWYPICATTTRKKAPWIELTQVPARQVEFAGAKQASPQNTNGAGDLQWIIDDYTSEGYKHGTDSIPQGNVGIKSIKRVGVALTWPFQLFKCKAA